MNSDAVIWIVTIAFLAIIVARHFTLTHNNSCKSSSDYYSNRDKNVECYYNPDLELSVPDIIVRYGYQIETYEVETEDQYILKIYRIARGKNTDNSASKNHPVYLQHGLFQNSAAFLLMRNKSLPFMLSDAGYDVWLGNFRGTLYSKHSYLLKTEKKFWNYSLDEYAFNDLPAIIDLIYEHTQRKIIYIGYSFGATASYIYSARNSELAENKVKLLVSLGPTIHPREWKSWNINVFSMWKYIKPVLNFLTNGAIDIKNLLYFHWSDLCLPFPFQMKLCEIPIELTYDFRLESSDPENWPLLLVKNLDAVSIKAFNHLTQIVSNGEFRNYDYGSEENKIIYGFSKPTKVDLHDIKIPTYILRAPNDAISTQKNVEFLYNNLPNDVVPYPIYVIKDQNFTHGDFLWNKNVVKLVNEPLIQILEKL